jgi:protoporphyrin/coproporphyrin ferrochelatase
MNKTAVILVNLGTPDSPRLSDVRRYLFQFLNDRRVIDLPWLLQKILVNLIIVPFRAPGSTKLYKRLWSEKGSPLLYYSEYVAEELKNRMGERYTIFNAMRYGNPDLKMILKQVEKQTFKKIIILPLFPQYASATTGSVFELMMKQMSSWKTFPDIQMLSSFQDHPVFINAFAAQGQKYDVASYDHVLFSFHGLPMRQINKLHPKKNCKNCTCNIETLPEGKLCYMAACYETARLIADKMGLAKTSYSVSFQSRLSNNWMSPFTDKVLTEMAKNGTKRILVFAPSFVADCLETKVEIEYEYGELFLEHGGEHLQMVESLNDNKAWIDGLEQLITEMSH